jgi:L-seryl-tRNA(Ser) seleniumtransferase
MIAAPADTLRARASALATRIGEPCEAVELHSTVGGGALPGQTLPSWGVALGGRSTDRALAALRRATPPVIGRIEDGRVVLDLRTVEPEHDDQLALAVAGVVGTPR